MILSFNTYIDKLYKICKLLIKEFDILKTHSNVIFFDYISMSPNSSYIYDNLILLISKLKTTYDEFNRYQPKPSLLNNNINFICNYTKSILKLLFRNNNLDNIIYLYTNLNNTNICILQLRTVLRRYIKKKTNIFTFNYLPYSYEYPIVRIYL